MCTLARVSSVPCYIVSYFQTIIAAALLYLLVQFVRCNFFTVCVAKKELEKRQKIESNGEDWYVVRSTLTPRGTYRYSDTRYSDTHYSDTRNSDTRYSDTRYSDTCACCAF